MSALAVEAMQSVSIGALDLSRVLTSANLFAGQDWTLPVINTVQLSLSGNSLTVISTDRYTAFREVVEIEGQGEWTFLLKVEDLLTIKAMIACATRGRSADVKRLLTVGLEVDGSMKVRVGSLTGEFAPREGEYPKILSLMDKDYGTDVSPLDFGINMRLMAKLAGVTGGSDLWNVTRYGVDTNPIFARPIAGDYGKVTVMLMPVRVDADWKAKKS